MLKARHEFDSWMSREAAFLANNWVLLFSAFFILFATLFPTITEAINGERLTVGPPFFNKWMTPIGLVLLFLTGVGPLLAWKKSSVANLRQQFLWPAVSALAVGGLVVALGVRVWSSGICFALCGFVFGTISQEFLRGANVRRGMTGADMLTAMIGLVGRNKRRYGGYIVHIGIVLIFLGFAGGGFSRDQQMLLRPGQEGTIRPYTLRLDALRVTEDDQKQMITAHVSIRDDKGRDLGKMYPAKWFFRNHTDEPTTEVAIRRSFGEDLYIVMPAFEVENQTASVEVHINPLVNWIWLGFGVLALGTAIALLPESAFSFAIGEIAGGSRGGDDARSGAAFVAGNASRAARRIAAESDIDHSVAGRARRRAQTGVLVRRMLQAAGRHLRVQPLRARERRDCRESQTRDERRTGAAVFHDQGGRATRAGRADHAVLGRFAWVIPYGIGATGLLLVGFAAIRWSHRRDDAVADERPGLSSGAADPLSAQLDDELRDLD